jgi:uncharacterized protein RhaS with RHS repeats
VSGITWYLHRAPSVAPTSYVSTVAYAWDAGDRLTDAVDSVSGTISRDFDGLDRLTEEQTPQGPIGHTYYANGLRQTMTVQGQSSVSYSYDNANRLTQISQGYAYVSGDPLSRTDPSGLLFGGLIDAGECYGVSDRSPASLHGSI